MKSWRFREEELGYSRKNEVGRMVQMFGKAWCIWGTENPVAGVFLRMVGQMASVRGEFTHKEDYLLSNNF